MSEGIGPYRKEKFNPLSACRQEGWLGERLLQGGKQILLILISTLGVVFAGIMLRARSPELTSANRVKLVGEWAPALLASSAAIGIMTMILIEGIKRPVRRRFHRRKLVEWLNIDIAEIPQEVSSASTDLLRLIAPRYANDIFGLPSEQLCAQISGAADVLISYPNENKRLLEALAGPEGSGDVATLLELLDPDESGSLPNQNQLTNSASSGGNANVSDDDSALVDARNKVGHRLQSNLDVFQVHVAAAWSELLRSAAIVIAGTLTAVGTFVFGGWVDQPVATLVFVLVVGLIGGFFSSVARDVTALIERLRR